MWLSCGGAHAPSRSPVQTLTPRAAARPSRARRILRRAGAASVAEVQSVAEDTERRRAALEERLVLALEAKAGIREVAAELELRATVADVNALLDTKATVADVNESLQLKANKASVVAALAQKAGRADLDALVAEREPRAAREAELRDALARLDREARALARALEAGLAEAAATRDELATRVRELPTVLELRRALAAKADASQLRELSKLNSDLSGLSSERSEHAAALVDAREASAREARAVREELGALRRLLDGKADRLAVGHALEAKLDAAAARRWVDLLGDADATAELGGGGGGGFGGFGGGLGGGLGSGLGGGLGGGDGGRLGGSSALGGGIALGGGGLGGGVRAGGLIGRLLEAKADKRDVVDRRLLDELARRVDAQLHALAEAARADARAEAERVVATKADAAAVDALASALAGKADAQRTRAQLDALAQGGGGGGAGASASEQALILESLCSEHLLGRWIWKSGRTKPGGAGAVPWNAQNINTNPENFLWEPDRYGGVAARAATSAWTLGDALPRALRADPIHCALTARRRAPPARRRTPAARTSRAWPAASTRSRLASTAAASRPCSCSSTASPSSLRSTPPRTPCTIRADG
jgi:hypothetical protein